ncbi:DUF6247 family protein [Microlunatus parietis]|uniref:Prevent-host-death family protein n=1 Tax=Microlunatus parietis TaxID=682979 RepID=A0A7Y9I3C2_9ACTN|nr:DUF6247 family protein [Microlunatus parietis]NYE69428.1 hypothetical protein [Microlunatus parietis]
MPQNLQEVTFSELIQSPKDTVEKLNRAPRHALRLNRRGAEDLVLVAATQASQDQEVVGVAIRLLRAIMASPTTRSQYLLDLLPMVFRWVRFLPDEDRLEFARELIDVMEACEELDNFTPMLDLIEQWRHSAEVYADPELFRALRSPDTVDAGQVTRPTA